MRVATRPDDRHQLQDDDQVDHPVGRPEFSMWRSEPVRHDTVFRDPIQDAIRTDNRRVDRAGEHQESDDDDECLEQQLERHRTRQVDGNTADQVVEILWPHVVRNQRVREERDERREQQ